MTIQVKNKKVLIDVEDMDKFNMFNWHISDGGYVVWRGILGGRKRTVRLHRIVIGAKEGETVDHINRNKLDNRKSNLRIVDHATNIKNSDRYERAKNYYYDRTKKRWAIDSKKYGIRSLYMDSEQACKDYLEAINNGEKPKRVFTRRASLGGRKLTDENIDYIFTEFEKGRTRTSIAEDLGVSLSAVTRIVSGQTTMGGTISRRTSK